MLWKWHIEHVGYWGCVDVWDVRYWGCEMLEICDVGGVGCSGFGMFEMQDVGCGMFAGMWDVDLQNASYYYVLSSYLECFNRFSKIW